jgi:hypothetical protein
MFHHLNPYSAIEHADARIAEQESAIAARTWFRKAGIGRRRRRRRFARWSVWPLLRLANRPRPQ